MIPYDFTCACIYIIPLSVYYHTTLQNPENIHERHHFEKVCKRFGDYNDNLASGECFVLGFYVSVLVTRWWDQWNSIPWVDRLAHTIIANVKGTDTQGRIIRRNLIRYNARLKVLARSTVSMVC